MSNAIAPGQSFGMQSAEGFTEAEEALLMRRLMPLLHRQTEKLLQGDSTSLRVEVAEELMASIRFTLRFYCTENKLPCRMLLQTDLPILFAKAQAQLLAVLKDAQTVYRRMAQSIRLLGSRSLADTLHGMANFFARYDARLFAHASPGDIDYQLCHPIPESVQGIQYIRAYLMHLAMEDALLSRLDETRTVRLLRRVNPLYGELLINLYEPVAQQVTALAFLGSGVTLLEVTHAQGAWLAEKLTATPKAEAVQLLLQAALAACARLGLETDAQRQYLMAAAETLYPRIAASPEAVHGALVTV